MEKNIPIITNDPEFSGRIGPFITAHLDVLESYDNLRPEGHPYEFVHKLCHVSLNEFQFFHIV